MEATTEEGEAEPGSREVEICEGLPPLVLSQRFVGSSGCQVWDAGITLLAYLTRLAEPLAAHPRVVGVPPPPMLLATLGPHPLVWSQFDHLFACTSLCGGMHQQSSKPPKEVPKDTHWRGLEAVLDFRIAQ